MFVELRPQCRRNSKSKNPVHLTYPLNPVKEQLTTKNMEVNEITHKIIGCCMEVHNTLGNGFQEVVYQRALKIEMSLQGLRFERELEMPLEYKGESIGSRRVDFFVESKIMLELKAIEQILPAHKAQAINYCEAYKIADGLLINFGGASLDYRRVYNKKMRTPFKEEKH